MDHLYLLEPREWGDAQRLRIRTWRTSDGSRWQRQGPFEWRLPARVTDDWRIALAHVVAAPDRLVMFGTVEPCCGAGGGIPPGSRYASINGAGSWVHVPLGGLLIWTSPDGARWTRRSTRDLRDPESGNNAWVYPYAVPGGVSAIRATTDDALLWSPDVDGWESMGPLPPAYDGTGPVELVMTDANVVMAFDDDVETLEVWLRDAEGGWTRSLRMPSMLMTGLVTTGMLVVAAGQRAYPGEESWPRILVSTDGGVTWDPDLSWSGARGGCTRDLATDGTRLVLFGCAEGAPTLWHADVPTSAAGVPLVAR